MGWQGAARGGGVLFPISVRNPVDEMKMSFMNKYVRVLYSSSPPSPQSCCWCQRHGASDTSSLMGYGRQDDKTLKSRSDCPCGIATSNLVTAALQIGWKNVAGGRTQRPGRGRRATAGRRSSGSHT